MPSRRTCPNTNSQDPTDAIKEEDLPRHKQPRLNWCHQGGGLAQTQTAKPQLMLSRYVDSPNTSSQTRSDHGEITDIVCGLDTQMTNESCSLRLTTACFDVCAVVTTSGQSPHPFHWPHIADLPSYTSSCELPECPQAANLWVAHNLLMPGIYSFSAQISAYFILFCFFKNCPQSKLFGG